MLYTIWTIGCQMNKADSERVAAALEGIGLRPAGTGEAADVVILNTCVVRGNAEEKVMGKLGALTGLKRWNPQLVTGVMGCLVPPDRQDLAARFPQVDLFFTSGETARLVDLVESRKGVQASGGLRPTDPARVLARFGESGSQSGLASTGLTPSGAGAVVRYVPIIYGCNNFCAYCIVPFRRGREVSRPPDEILASVKACVAAGAREITLLGQNVDAYRGRSAGDSTAEPTSEPTDLADLLRLVHDVPGLARLRFLTSHPRDMSHRLMAAVADLPRVCPAINLPVQAGDDEVLRRMGRGYTVEDYRRLVRRMRQSIPRLALSTDLIVGFPGESEEQFQHSMDLLAELRFDMVHVAAYSPRPGTRAAAMVDDVPPSEKGRRLQAVESLQLEVVGQINRCLLQSPVEVLVEDRHKGKWRGRTASDKLVFFEHGGDWRGKLVRVMIHQTGAWSLQGTLIEGE